jgi:splicing factor 3A subunit 1
VDKTAEFVAKNGSSFEAMIIKAESNNPKFTFLKNQNDPFRAYYEKKIAQFAMGTENTAKKTADQKKNNE